MTIANPGIKIGIIGTAGRKEDAEKLNPEKFQQMKAAVLGIIAPHTSKPITFVSGGAAVADHIAVQLFLALPNTRLHLHLPAQYDMALHKFVEEPGKMFAPGNIANYYHRQFWKRCRQSSLDELHQAISCGAQATVTPGFKQRNSKVANDADLMVALTFGEGAMLKDGGTLDCMTKFLQRHAGESAHVDLHTMQVYSPAVVTMQQTQEARPATPELSLE